MDGLLFLGSILYVSFIFICLIVVKLNNVFTDFLPAGSVHHGGAETSNNGFIYFTFCSVHFCPTYYGVLLLDIYVLRIV